MKALLGGLSLLMDVVHELPRGSRVGAALASGLLLAFVHWPELILRDLMLVRYEPVIDAVTGAARDSLPAAP